MKYIRTKTFITVFEERMRIVDNYLIIGGCQHKIIKQADTIEELIMPGDLVRVGLTMVLVEKDRGDELRGIDMGLIKRNAIETLWLGDEDEEKFIKCATKKEGDDYLTLCD